MKSWYTIRARASGTEVLIYDEIGAYGVSAKGFLAELGALPGDAAIDQVERLGLAEKFAKNRQMVFHLAHATVRSCETRSRMRA